MRITFIMPSSGLFLSGGFKIVYEYANRLVKDGLSVNIVYPLAVTWEPFDIIYRIKRVLHYARALLTRSYKPSWFNIDSRIKQFWIPFLSSRFMPKSDCIFATGWETAIFLNGYQCKPCKKYYFIQSFEDWCGPREKVEETWKYPMKKIVIAPWLKEIADGMGEESILIENGFDFEAFPLINPIESRNKYSVIMLYHEAEFKGSKIGLKALEIVKNKYPKLQGIFFGTPEPPKDLPEWIEYHRAPEELFGLYNRAAIYMGTSAREGFSLTIAEAMQCGCAVVCTDIGGYKIVAENNTTALVSPVGDADSLGENVMKLIEDDALRIKIASNGSDRIKTYTWNRAYKKLKDLINNDLNN